MLQTITICKGFNCTVKVQIVSSGIIHRASLLNSLQPYDVICCGRYMLPLNHLTHLPLDKMAAMSQMIFSDAFLWMESFVFWLKCSLIKGQAVVQVLRLILNSAIGLWMGIHSAGELVFETSQLRILHSSEKHNLSPFDLKIAGPCQSIDINNNKDAYMQC